MQEAVTPATPRVLHVTTTLVTSWATGIIQSCNLQDAPLYMRTVTHPNVLMRCSSDWRNWTTALLSQPSVTSVEGQQGNVGI